MRLLFCISFFVLFSITANGQEQWVREVDSLKAVVRQTTESKLNPEVYFAIAYLYRMNNPDSSLMYNRKGGLLSEKNNDTSGTVSYLIQMSGHYGMLSNHDSCLFYCEALAALSRKMDKPFNLAIAYSNMASVYSEIENPEKALKYYQLAIDIYEKLNNNLNNENLAINYGNLLSMYVELEQPEKAFTFGMKALAFCERTNQLMPKALVLANLSALLQGANKYDSALLLSREQYAIGRKLNDKFTQVNALGSIVNSLLQKDRDNEVKALLDTMQQFAMDVQFFEGLAIAHHYRAIIAFNQKDYATANNFALSALKILDSQKIHTATERDIYSTLSEIQLADGNLLKFRHFKRIFDSLQKIYFSNKILKYNQQLQTEYEVNKKQSEIDSLTRDKKIQALTMQHQRQTNIILGGMILFLLLISFLAYRNYRQKNQLLKSDDALKKQRISELEKEKQLLAVQSVFQGQEEERKRMATDLHDGLAGILLSTKYSFGNVKDNLVLSEDSSNAFEKSMAMIDMSIHELRRVAHNLMPEALVKFGLDTALNDFCININNNSKVLFTYQSFNMNDEKVPKNVAGPVYRMIQELSNNILKHAQATTALIQLIFENNALSITVEDNGKGFEVNSLKGAPGIGYSILQSRVTYLKGTIDVHSDSAKGTSVSINIPDISL